MKLAVINFSGNVGKTTVARHLLAPRIPGCQVVSVESINADDGQPVTIRGRQFAQLQEFLQSVDDVVIASWPGQVSSAVQAHASRSPLERAGNY